MYSVKTGDQINQYKKDKKLRVLVVDDDDNSRELLCSLLQFRGYDVVGLDEGMKSVNRCMNTTFDIIFMDHHTNDLDGEVTGSDCSRMISEMNEGEQTIIFAYTGDNSTKAFEEFKQSGMAGALIKPVDPGLLNNVLDLLESNELPVKYRRLMMRNKNFYYFNTN